MEKKIKLIIFALLLIGVIYRLVISSNGNFIFNMDNARDMVDVREMVVLGKLRLIGQTTSIDGVFYGPAWYYILSIPFILSGGNPYFSIILEIILWTIGGYFLFYLAYKFYGGLAMVTVAALWIASNFILLGSQYTFNPNPILFLTPLFIFSTWKYLETGKNLFNIVSWFLAGLFLHFEVTVGLFMPAVILLSIMLTKRWTDFKNKKFYLGILVFLITLLPQVLFELRHSFFMTKSLLNYQSISHGGVDLNPIIRTTTILRSYYDTLLPTFMNFELFTKGMLVLFAVCLILFKRTKKSLDKMTLVTILAVITPLIGLIPLKVEIMRWYLNSAIVASILLVGFVIFGLNKSKGKFLSVILVLILLIFTVNNMGDYIRESKKPSHDPAILKNEISSIDYVYQKAEGRNFKVYVYLPSVIDYPYQYLFWWHGLKKYGYVPEDYAYAPDKPPYISQKEKLEIGNNPPPSGLVFLIKQPDQTGIRHLWENTFKELPLVSSEKVGPNEIEIRNEPAE